ncbi:MAG: HigA family addiction module antidote protein [Opitutales bacterium]|nr:HigA family addiction module antidote protein [Opitutales bacterium]
MIIKTETLHFSHPGEILRAEFLNEMNLTQYRLAVDTGIPHSRISAIVAGRRAITPDSALRLARYFGNSPDFWLGLQKEYDLRRAREELGERIEHEVRPLVCA